MAVSSTTATVCISQTQKPKPFTSSQADKLATYTSQCFLRLPLKQRTTFLIHSSSDAPQLTSPGDASQETVSDEESESSVEASKLPYSLISALNVEKVLRGIAITDADYYGRLGIQKGCPYDQVPIAYKLKCEELINQGLEEEELRKRLELLKESYMILSSEEERRFYDWSLTRSENSETYVWPFEVDITQTPTELPPPEEPEDVGPTRLVGYFFIGWLVLSFVLSIALNR